MVDRFAADLRAAFPVQRGWSRNVLQHHLATVLHRREGEAPSNVAAQLPAPDSDLEQSLVDRLQDTLTEFGHGTAFVGYTYDCLPAEERAALPDVDTLTSALGGDRDR
ncbi:hypothetical protein AB2L28_20360 [Kineococcus sp. TBRC 1896]|uniref:Uncharacterized protein n=1 Tax=Kineococcus mangrovi TaxID=1660183 RepID=A0ABV4I7D8_9ACTN